MVMYGYTAKDDFRTVFLDQFRTFPKVAARWTLGIENAGKLIEKSVG